MSDEENTKKDCVDCAKKVHDGRVKIGQMVKVENTERPSFSNARRFYNAVWVTDSDGSNERCLLLTDSEMKRIEHRSSQNREDWTKRTFWSKLNSYSLFSK